MNLPHVHAHCDGPCGIYDPASARIPAEAVLSMTKKILALVPPPMDSKSAYAAYLHTFSRYVAIKEEQADESKRQLLILWTDYFKPDHLEAYPHLHELFWTASKLCSACKQENSLTKAQALLTKVQAVHELFWQSKGRTVDWITAG